MNLYRSLRTVYGKSAYMALNLLILLAYYEIVERILAIQQFGIVIATAPVSLILSLVLTSSILLTIAIYTIVESRKGRRAGYRAAGSSCAVTVLGGVMSGCGCQGAILYSALAIVVGSGEAYAINTIFTEHIALVLAALTIFNITFIVYSLSRVQGGRAK